jgi:hypothetical protein
MSIKTQIAALQALHRTVSGIKTASTSYPSQLTSAALPLVLVVPNRGIWQQVTIGDLRRQDRTYRVQVFVAPVATANDKAVQDAIDLLQAFGDLYLGAITLDSSNEQVTLEGPITDTGLVELQWGGIAYHGFEFQVSGFAKW